MKYYDMPPGNDICVAYEQFLEHTSVGRTTTVVPMANGTVYRYSSRFSKKAETQDESIRQAIKHATHARAALRAEGHEPVVT